MIRTSFLFVVVATFLSRPDLATAQAVDLTVDQSQSSITVEFLGSSDTSSLTGFGTIELVPVAEPFSTAQILELELVIADGFNISFLGGFVSVSADPEATCVTLVMPGAAGSVTMANEFDQLANEAGLSGEVDVFDPFNLAGGSGTIFLADSGTAFFDMLGVQLDVESGMLSVAASVDFEVDLDDSISVAVTATVVLTGKLPTILVGDVNCDGAIDLLDVAPFVELITSGQFSDKADINGDLAVDLLDVAPFVTLLTGG